MMTSRALLVRISLASMASNEAGVKRFADSNRRYASGSKFPFFAKLCALHDRFAQVFVGDRQAHLFRHVQPHAIVDELLSTNCFRNSSLMSFCPLSL